MMIIRALFSDDRSIAKVEGSWKQTVLKQSIKVFLISQANALHLRFSIIIWDRDASI